MQARYQATLQPEQDREKRRRKAAAPRPRKCFLELRRLLLGDLVRGTVFSPTRPTGNPVFAAPLQHLELFAVKGDDLRWVVREEHVVCHP